MIQFDFNSHITNTQGPEYGFSHQDPTKNSDNEIKPETCGCLRKIVTCTSGQ